MDNGPTTKPFVEPVLVPYIDEERDDRDSVACDALSAAIQLIEDDDADHVHRDQALAVIRLVKLCLSDNSKHTAELNVEVAHG